MIEKLISDDALASVDALIAKLKEAHELQKKCVASSSFSENLDNFKAFSYKVFIHQHDELKNLKWWNNFYYWATIVSVTLSVTAILVMLRLLITKQ